MNKDWEIKKLGDVCIIKGRIGFRGYTKSDLVKKGEGAITLSPSNIIDNKLIFDNCSYISWPKYDESPEIQLAIGDIVFCKTASIGKTALVNELPEKTTLNPQFIVLKKITCEKKFLYYYLICPTFKNKISQITTGTAVPTLSQSNFSNLPISLPPLEEQKRIVKILDEKFAQLETIKTNAQTNLQNAKDLFQSQLAKAFNNTSWEKKRLDDVCELISGYAFDSKGYSTNDNDTLLICGDNIMHCSFRWETVKRWSKEQYSDLKRFELQDSDIVLAMDRPWIKSGLKISKITKNELPSLLVQRTAALRTSNKMISDYLYYALQVEGFSKYLIEQQTGVGVPHISGKQILNYEIPLPPLPEQKRIVKELDTLSEKVRQLQEIYTKQITNCDELKQAYLQKAFEGEL